MFDFLSYGADRLQAFLLVMLRCSGVFIIAPFFSSRAVPVLLKLGLLITLSALLTSSLSQADLPALASTADLAALAFRETLIGFIIGFGFYLILAGVHLGGTLVGYQMGFSVANLFDPSTSEQVPILGQFWMLTATVVFLAINGHHLILKSLVDSYLALPLGTFALEPALGMSIVKMSVLLFAIALKVAIPVVAALLLVDVALGVLSKSMPTANVFFIGIPIKVAVGLLVMAVSLPLFNSIVQTGWGEIDKAMQQFYVMAQGA